MQFGDALGLAFDDFDGFFSAHRDGSGKGVGEKAGAGALLKDFDGIGGGSDVTAGGAAERFAERAGEHVDLAVEAEMLGRAAAADTEDADAVRIIDDKQRGVMAAERDELRKFGDIAFHAEHAVGDDPATGFTRVGFQFDFEIGEVAVLIDLARDCFADEADAVDDTGVVELIGKDHVVRANKRGEQGFVGVPAAHIRQGRRSAGEAGDGLFDFAVAIERAAYKADGGGAGTVFFEAVDPSRDDFGVIGEAEVVVGTEDDDLTLLTIGAFDLCGWAHRADDAVEALELAGVAERLEEVGGAGVEGEIGHGCQASSRRLFTVI